MLRRLMMAGAGGGGGSGDPHFANVVSLLNFQGPDGSTTFTDAKGKAWTAVGNAQINSNSGLFDGNGDYIFSAANSDFCLGEGDYTAEAVINCGPINPNGSAVLAQQFSTHVPIALAFTSGTSIGAPSGNIPFFGFYDGTWRGIKSASAIPLNSDVHLAGVKSGTTYMLFVNGTLAASGTIAVVPPTITNQMRIARRWDSGGNPDFNGRIKGVRLTKGVARYTSNFTPPSVPFPTD